ncbi:MAG: polysaccharide deacetylase family protein [Candidatus Methanofastidiosia archaeon]
MRFPTLLTFDFDAEFVMQNLYPKDRYWLSQGEYGGNVGIYRILSLLEREKIKATFCVVGKAAEKYPKAVLKLTSLGHEVAVHGYTHKAYQELSFEEEYLEITKTSKILRKLTGEKPYGHRTPGWRPSENTIKILSHKGFLWSSDYLGCDTPFFHEMEGRKTKILEIPVAYTLDDWDLFFGGNTPSQVFEVWKEEFDCLFEEKKLFCLTCHPLVSGRPSRLKALKLFISHVKKHKEAEFMRIIDFVREFEKS